MRKTPLHVSQHIESTIVDHGKLNPILHEVIDDRGTDAGLPIRAVASGTGYYKQFASSRLRKLFTEEEEGFGHTEPVKINHVGRASELILCLSDASSHAPIATFLHPSVALARSFRVNLGHIPATSPVLSRSPLEQIVALLQQLSLHLFQLLDRQSTIIVATLLGRWLLRGLRAHDRNRIRCNEFLFLCHTSRGGQFLVPGISVRFFLFIYFSFCFSVKKKELMLQHYKAGL